MQTAHQRPWGRAPLFCSPRPTTPQPRSAGAPSVEGVRRQQLQRWRQASLGGDQPGSGGSEGSSGGGDSGGDSLREQARLLNELFYASDAPVSDYEDPAHGSAASGAPVAAASGPLLLTDLPLWRVQWGAVPGSLEVLHVHVPHYVAMFEKLFRQPRPWRYGCLLLPEGSKNLGNPEFALAPGTKAPLVGALMEVLQAVRFGDGRLLVLAVGVARLRVLRPTQEVPYSRADCELLLDAEEQQEFEPLALQALESVAGGLDSGSGGDSGSEAPPLAALMAALPAAAREAAAAWATAWGEYELSDLREQSLGSGVAGSGDGGPVVLDGTRPAEAQALGRRLAALAGNDVLAIPYFERLESAAQAAGAPGRAELLRGSAEDDGGAALVQEAVDSQRPVLRQTEASAYASATGTAARALERRLRQPPSEGGGGSGADAASQAPAGLNTAAERGIEYFTPREILGEDVLDEEPDSLQLALRLEAAVWQEIDAVQRLAAKLQPEAPRLPSGLQCLRPMQQPVGRRPADTAGAEEPAAAAGREQAVAGPPAPPEAGAHPDYPALRRCSRLSFAVTAWLTNVSATEGRQAWVEAGSICARLRLGLASLRKHRKVLAAVVAVEGL